MKLSICMAPTDDGWHGWIANGREKVFPLGRLHRVTAAGILFGEVLSNEKLGRVAAKMLVPELPAELRR